MKLLKFSLGLLYCGSQHATASCTAPPYRDSLVTLHKSLIDIPSVTGTEADVAEFLANYLSDHGFTADRQVLSPSSDSSSADARFNVIAWPNTRTSNSSKVVITSHIDTVPPHIPYTRTGPEPPTVDTVIAGRGSVDAKGSVATQIIAVLELLQNGAISDDDVMLAFVVGEEVTGDGMAYFSDMMAAEPNPPRVAIFGEPTEGRLACGHKGGLSCNVTARGTSGHSGYPWLFKSANELLMRAMVQAIDADFGTSAEFGNTTTNVGLMEGGTAINVVPDEALARIVVRVGIGPENGGSDIVRERLVELLNSVDDKAFELVCNSEKSHGAIECSCDVESFETTIVNYGTDIPNFKGNHTRYLYGPGSILVSHGPDEAITLRDLEIAVEDYKKLILHALQT